MESSHSSRPQCRPLPQTGELAAGHALPTRARVPRQPFAAHLRQNAHSSASETRRICRGPAAAQAAPPLQGVPAIEQAAQPSSSSNGSNGSAHEAEEQLVFAPEDFTLPPGVPSPIDRESPAHPADVFRCPGCTEPACQGAGGCARMQWRHSAAGYLRKILSSRVYDVAIETPLEEAPRLSEQSGNSVLLKREDMQSVFSFKLRGAFNKMASLTPEQRQQGVVCSSAGNHAQGVALAARTLGCRATICMPVVSPEIKVRAVQRLGGTVELVGETYTETQAHAQAKAAAEGLVFIPPYDDPYIIAGQGTAGAEILRQLSSPQRDSLEAVFVAVGGGGLAAGVASYVKQLLPHVKVFGVEPAGANCMAISLSRGRRVSLSKVDAFADGVAVKTVGAEPFRLCRQLLDGVLLVDNRAISAAIEAVFNDKRSILEPAGAVAVAGATHYLEQQGLRGRTVVAITSGANMNFDRLRLVAELAGVGARQEAIFATTLPERPGAFKAFIDAALADTALQITEFKYRYSAAEHAHVLWGASVTSSGEADALTRQLDACGLPTRNASGIEAVQVHLRHLVGGRARSYTGVLPHERIMQVDFPERAGALRDFLDQFVPAWNITLFHYRKSGNQSSSALIGVQVPPETAAAFEAAQAALAGRFSFSELGKDARQVFDMFIS